MTPNRAPSEDRLLAYAAGNLSPPEAVVVATHLALRPANDAVHIDTTGLSIATVVAQVLSIVSKPAA